jgi:hypothetical protein
VFEKEFLMAGREFPGFRREFLMFGRKFPVFRRKNDVRKRISCV